MRNTTAKTVLYTVHSVSSSVQRWLTNSSSFLVAPALASQLFSNNR